MVGEIGGRTCIIEREHTSDEETALVVRGCEWTTEGGTCLTITHIAVGEEYGS